MGETLHLPPPEPPVYSLSAATAHMRGDNNNNNNAGTLDADPFDFDTGVNDEVKDGRPCE
jgi:hypothetical protein